MKDFYKILGLEKGASVEEIKKAYRTLAHKHHPDKAGGNESKFKEINEAYQILSNPEKKAQYDRFGQTFDGQSGGSGFGGQNPFGVEFDFGNVNVGDLGNLGEMFDSFFEGLGVKRKRRTYRHGSDVEYTQEISLEEAFRGAVKPLAYKTHVACKECSGAGHFAKEGFSDCSTCNGRGEIKEVRSTFFGNFEQVRACEKCSGTGQIPKKICRACSGTGRVKGERAVDITIAPGIMEGQLIKIQKGGEVGERGADAGDLYVRVKIQKHPVFDREGDDLITRRQFKLADVLLGRKIMIDGIAGEKVGLEIARGFRLGDPVVVSGAGMPRLGGYGRGRLIVYPDVHVPQKISPKAKKLLEDLEGEL